MAQRYAIIGMGKFDYLASELAAKGADALVVFGSKKLVGRLAEA